MIKDVQEYAQPVLLLATEKMKFFYDKEVKDGPVFEKGDQVWFEAENICTMAPSKKLDHKYLGPFKVVCQVSTLDYKLELPFAMKVHPVFHVSLLLPYVMLSIPGHVQDPAPPVEVEEVLDS